MKPQSNIKRSKTYAKTTYVHMDKYKPRDWDYQNTRHQIIPPFVIGRYKRRIPPPKQEEFPVFQNLTKSQTSTNFHKRELKPSVYRSYILSQIATLPGAVKVEENKINDDQKKKDRIIVYKNNNLCYKNKLKTVFGSKVPFLPGSKEEKKDEEKITVTLKKGKSTENLMVGTNTNKKLKVNRITSPDRNRIKRNKKN
jgi:hypothetical protein